MPARAPRLAIALGLPLGLLIAASPALAQTIYKSVDESGNVTFSETPPADATQVERVQVEPPPSEAQRQAADAEVKRIQSKADQMGANRRQREEEAARAAAEKASEPTAAPEEETVQRTGVATGATPPPPVHLPVRPRPPGDRPATLPAKPARPGAVTPGAGSGGAGTGGAGGAGSSVAPGAGARRGTGG